MDTYLLELECYAAKTRQEINSFCKEMEPLEIIIYSVAATFLFTCALCYLRRPHRKSFYQRLKQFIFHLIRHIPGLKQKIERELSNASAVIKRSLHKGMEHFENNTELPQVGWPREKILSSVEAYEKIGSADWKRGRVSGTVYKEDDETLAQLVTQVYGQMAWTNPLHPDVFPGVRKMEAEIVRMVCNLYNGGPDSCGTVTTGGTESIFMASKAYRDYAIQRKGIDRPEMIVPISAHAAFDKSAQILDVKIIHVPMDPETMKVDVRAMRRAINGNTCMLVGSAPHYPHGIIDPIEEIAKLGKKYGVPVHVDCCLGGFLVPFLKECGFPVPPFDFTVPGVTSISCDTHKYGYTPKGTSVILYARKIYRHHQFSVLSNWPGGIYATPNLAGSRAGGTIGTCWATLLYFGRQGYVEATKKIISTRVYIEKQLREIDGIFVFGEPQASVIAIGSRVFDVYRLSVAVVEKGWNINQLQFPAGFHICLTQLHTHSGVADQFVQDVKSCTSQIMKDVKAPATGTAAIYGMAQSIPDRSFVDEIGLAFVDACYELKKDG